MCTQSWGVLGQERLWSKEHSLMSREALELLDEFGTSLITSKSIQEVVPRRSGEGNRRGSTNGASLESCGFCGHGWGETMTSIESNILLRLGQLWGTPVVQSYLAEGCWLHCMWCTFVNSLVPDLWSDGAEVIWSMQDLAWRLIYEWMKKYEVIKTFNKVEEYLRQY